MIRSYLIDRAFKEKQNEANNRCQCLNGTGRSQFEWNMAYSQGSTRKCHTVLNAEP